MSLKRLFFPWIALLAACSVEVIQHDPPPVIIDTPECADDDTCESCRCVDERCVPVTEAHPRLWVRPSELESLRARAVATNPVFQAGLGTLATTMTAWMDSPPSGMPGNRLPDSDVGNTEWTQYPIEPAAQLFAFLSLVSPEPAQREAYADRAKTLLMYVATRAAEEPDATSPFRHPNFAIGGRAQWSGESLPLTADWIHDQLTIEERRVVRRAFLRWGRTLSTWYDSPFRTPADRALRHDPALLDLGDPRHHRLRNSLGAQHAYRTRNLALLGLALDPDDDVDDPKLVGPDAGALHTLRDEALAGWLYVMNEALLRDGAGGIPATGNGRLVTALGPPLQLLLALATAGHDDDAGVARFGPQVRSSEQPFWSAVVAGYLASMPDLPKNVSGLGRIYQPSTFGPMADYYAEDPTTALAPLALLARRHGDDATAETVRWINREIPLGGPAREAERLRGSVSTAILAFLLAPATSEAPRDPRSSRPDLFTAPAIGRVLARHGSGEAAGLVSFRLGWIDDDQFGDGLQFDFHRKGEWLTKDRAGLGYLAAGSDYRNSLTIETSALDLLTSPTALVQARRGSQHLYGRTGQPPPPLVSKVSGAFVVSGDARALYEYTSDSIQVDDVREARRVLVWLPPDRLVVFDRIRATGSNRAKRFWLNLPGPATIEGPRVTAPTPGGQRLSVTTLLPAEALGEVVDTDAEIDALDLEYSFSAYDPLNAPYTFPGQGPVRGVRRWKVEAPGHPTELRFLHVLEGLDEQAPVTASTLLRATSGDALTGCIVGSDAVLVADKTDAPLTDSTVELPANLTRVLVTGLVPGATYDIDDTLAGATRTLRLRTGTAVTADASGTITR